MKNIVITLHGIRTRGAWQKELVTCLCKTKRRCIPYPLDYGYFSSIALLIPLSRTRKINWFRQEYTRICETEGISRPSVICHSFGTFIVAKAMETYPQIKFDKVILCGSILEKCLNWTRFFEGDRINLVRNDYGSLDVWPRIAKALITGAGSSGTEGFETTHPALENNKFDNYKHSHYFHRLHFNNEWLPFLQRLVLNEKDCKKITRLLDILTKAVSETLGIEHSHLRSNIFWPDHEEVLFIPKGLHYHMLDSVELTVRLFKGSGCTGKAYALRCPVIAIFKGGWGQHTIEDEELKKVDKDLKWILSMPIPDPDEPYEILGILNVDCRLTEKSREEIESILDDVRTCSQAVGKVFKEIS